MKRYAKLVLMLVFLLGFTFFSLGQNKMVINQAAAEITSELKNQVKFDSEQEDLIYESYVLYHKKLKHIDKLSTINSGSAAEEKKKVYSELCDTLKKILNKEQFARFEAFEKYKSN